MFKQLYLKYLKRLMVFTIIVMAAYIGCHYFCSFLLSPFCIYLIVFFLIIMAVSHAVVLRTDAMRLEFAPDPETDEETRKAELVSIEKKFVTRYMLTTTVKLLLFLVLLVVYAVLNRSDMLRFGLNFLVLYVAYSVFEIIVLKKPLLK